MNNNINLKDMWLEQPISKVNKEDLLLKIANFKKKNLKKLIILNIYIILTSLYIIFIWVHFQPKSLTTKIGMVLVILGMILKGLTLSQSFSLLRKLNRPQSNSDYLKNLLLIKEKQQFFQAKICSLFFFMLSIGLWLYMHEFTSKMTNFWSIFVYTLTSSWILFCWFYIRPKQIRNQQTKIDDIISKVKTLNKQLDE